MTVTGVEIVAILEQVVKLVTAFGVLYAIYQGKKIHTLVNSNFTKVTADLAIANQRIETLQSALVNKP